MATYKTPGVYVEEISLFPPSVAEVETAVPAFIGYTETALKNGVEDVELIPVKVTSMAEYEETFGYGPSVNIDKIELNSNNSVTSTQIKSTFYMYDAIRMCFNNGGGKCYIISIGSYSDAVELDKFTQGLAALKKKDEPTLIVFPDAVLLGDDLYTLQQQALKQANDLQDRFVVCDLLEPEDSAGEIDWEKGVDDFRDKIGINYLKYGAAYTPWLKTNLSKTVRYSDIRNDSSSGTNRLYKNGSPIDLNKLTSEPKVIQTIQNLEDALSDDKIINGDGTGSISAYLNGLTDKPETLQAGYNALAVAFKAAANTQLAKLTADSAVNDALSAAKSAKDKTDTAKLAADALTGASIEADKQTVLDALEAAGADIDSAADDVIAEASGQTATDATTAQTDAATATTTIQGYDASTVAFGDIQTTAGELADAASDLYDAALQAVQDTLDASGVRAEFKKLFEYVYGAADGLIDEWAKSGSSLKVNDEAVTALDTVKGFITSPLKSQIAKLNSYIFDPQKYIGGTELDKVYNNYTWDASEWSTTFTGASADNSIYEHDGSSTDLTSEEFIENMKGAESYVLSVFNQLNTAVYAISDAAETYISNFESTLKVQFPLYKNIIDKVGAELTIIPPSGAVVGIYSAVDRTRGVWKAPANVSLSYVKSVTVDIDHDEQESLNVDVVSGKSVNAIRYFTGKGVLIWGARTLAGNDNEWRYVPVRRFFNMVEESVKKSTYWAVFEPNDANTWIKVKAMIQNYLILKWKDGALAGAKPEEAFFVNVGLGTTMTAQDILEGRMNVEIGMAVVRPAEFIILKFSHKMQES